MFMEGELIKSLASNDDIVLRWVQALGFPICVSGVLLYALLKLGNRLLDVFLEHIKEIVPMIGNKFDEVISKLGGIEASNAKIADRVDELPSEKYPCKAATLEDFRQVVADLLQERGIVCDDREKDIIAKRMYNKEKAKKTQVKREDGTPD